MVRLLSMLIVIAAAIAAASAQQPTLRDMARLEDVRQVINNDYSPETLENILRASDTIVLETVDFGRPVLSKDERQIFTDYQVTLRDILRRDQPPGLDIGDALTVRRWGGAMTLEGHTVVAEENDFPPFNAGELYVLFLQTVPNEPFYYLSYGPQAAFRVAGTTVRQVSTKFGSWNVDHPAGAARAEFVNAVKAQVRQLR